MSTSDREPSVALLSVALLSGALVAHRPAYLGRG
jgi:hypothetical protein